MAAVFSHIFLEAKERLKNLLNERTFYVDGKTPDEIAARLRLEKDVSTFFENDLTK